MISLHLCLALACCTHPTTLFLVEEMKAERYYEHLAIDCFVEGVHQIFRLFPLSSGSSQTNFDTKRRGEGQTRKRLDIEMEQAHKGRGKRRVQQLHGWSSSEGSVSTTYWRWS